MTKESSGTTAVVTVALVFSSGIAINQLSDLFEPSPIAVIALSIVVLLAMVLFERSREPGDPSGLRMGEGFKGALHWTLVSVVVGTALAAIWLLPFVPDEFFSSPRRFSSERYVYSLRELGGAILISIVSSVAAIRRKSSVVDLSIFIVFAVTGFTLVHAWYPRQLVFAKFTFTGTFLGWLLFVVLVTAVLGTVPNLLKLMARFLGLAHGSPRDA